MKLIFRGQVSGVRGQRLAVEVLEEYIECCVVKGACTGCPFYTEGIDGMPGKCLGTKEYGQLLKGCLSEIKEELGKIRNKK